MWIKLRKKLNFLNLVTLEMTMIMLILTHCTQKAFGTLNKRGSERCTKNVFNNT